MNSAVRLRLILLITAIALMAGLTLLGMQESWRRIARLERKLTAGQFESFRLASEFQQRLLTLENLLLNYSARRSPETWAEFEKAGTQLDGWIDEQATKLSTTNERDLLHQLNKAYGDYLGAAHQVLTNQHPEVISTEVFAQLQHVESHADRLHQLGIMLAEAHRQAEQLLLGETSHVLSQLRTFLFVGVVLLLALVAALGIVFYRDLIAPLKTKLVLSEVLLEKQEKLATLGTLAAGIAHEIRNPLTSIKARLYMLGKRVAGDAASTADAGIINAEIARLEHIVQTVLQFARPSDPELQVLPADAPFREIVSLMGTSLDQGRVQLTVAECPALPVSIDATLIKQVLLNLVRNGVEAIEGSGTVTLRVRSGHALLQGNPCSVAILEVSDTGKGISPEVEKRLFDPFFTTKETGTGLGLSIAARIIEKHGGALEYQTHAGRGTTFGIVLPVVPPPSVSNHVHENATSDPADRR